MYSPRIIEQKQNEIEARLKLKLNRYSSDESWAWRDYLEKRKLKLLPNQPWWSQLKLEEQTFITNERLLCSIDFSYWWRYAFFLADPAMGGGLKAFSPWGPQQIILKLISSLEEQMTDMAARGEPVDGILIVINKARQLGATMFARMLLMHRVTTQMHERAVTASVDPDKVDALYIRDNRILENLPFYLVPAIGFNEKSQHITFSRLDNSLLYQLYTQKSGLAQGEQYDLGHMTECASHPYPGEFDHNYFPTIPQSPRACHLLESTPQGRGNWWHEFCTDLHQHRGAYSRWRLCFIPYYAEPMKYRRTPPTNWIPSDPSLAHAEMVWNTSTEYVGHRVMLSKETLFWYESERSDYARKGNLNLFLSNYSATMEEGFQHTTKSAFPAEMLDRLRKQTSIPQAYLVGN